jgi:hypothetical protein
VICLTVRLDGSIQNAHTAVARTTRAVQDSVILILDLNIQGRLSAIAVVVSFELISLAYVVPARFEIALKNYVLP